MSKNIVVKPEWSFEGQTHRTGRYEVKVDGQVQTFDSADAALNYAHSRIPARGDCMVEDYTEGGAVYTYRNGQRGINAAAWVDEDGVGHNYSWEPA